ncbi:MAG: choice-of-anchor A family protein, partial [Ruminococcus sp.]|nr:choice-of-anchor A family protein [Ruminococcus sp.]
MKTKRNRFLSTVTAALVAAAQAVPLLPSLNASAEVTNGCTVGNPVSNLSSTDNTEITDVDLLVGHNHPLTSGAASVADVIDNANSQYFLGIASQFSVFLNGNMIATAADSEGRTAVKGNFEFNPPEGNKYNYQAGSGDYGTGTPLEDLDEYRGVTNFANVITAGEHIHRVHTRAYRDYAVAENGLYEWKNIAVGSNFSLEDSFHMDDYNGNEVPYSEDCKCVGNGDELAHFYQSSAFDAAFFDAQFATIANRSSMVMSKPMTGSVTPDGDTITFDAGEGCTEKVIYFKVDDFTDFQNAVNIEYVNIPDGAYMIVSCDDTAINIGSAGKTKKTTINGDAIHNTGTYESNNHPDSSRILYNFPDALSVEIGCNFNGSILAPNADVTSDKECKGHLSGALVAKSFEGGLEFGYKPFLGPIDILGMNASYSLELDKFKEDGETFLPGAEIGIFSVKTDSEGNVVKDEKGNLKLTKVDSFITEENTNTFDIGTGKFVIKEIASPDGYSISDKEYYIEVIESDAAQETIKTGESSRIIPDVYTHAQYLDAIAEDPDSEDMFKLISRDVVKISGDKYWWKIDLSKLTSTENIEMISIKVDGSSSGKVFVAGADYKPLNDYEVEYTAGEEQIIDLPVDSAVITDLVCSTENKPSDIVSVYVYYKNESADSSDAAAATVVIGSEENNKYYKYNEDKTDYEGKPVIEDITVSITYSSDAEIKVYKDNTFTDVATKNEVPMTAKADLTTISENIYKVDDSVYKVDPANGTVTVTVPELKSAVMGDKNGTVEGNTATFSDVAFAKPTTKFTCKYTTENGKTIDDNVVVYFTGDGTDEGVVIIDGKAVNAHVNFSANENIGKLEITNQEALTFKKVDENGNAVSNARIRFSNRTYKSPTMFDAGGFTAVTSEGSKVWLTGVNSKPFSIGKDLKTLVIESPALPWEGTSYKNIYTIRELDPPSGYLLADWIYFFLMKDGEEIYLYSNSAANDSALTMPTFNGEGKIENLNGWTKTDISDESSRVIKMVDVEKPSFSIAKIDSGSKVKLAGAELTLIKLTDAGIAKIDTLMADSVETFKLDELDAATDYTVLDTYTDTGALWSFDERPEIGVYALVETAAPANYSESDVNVVNLFSITYNDVYDGIVTLDLQDVEIAASDNQVTLENISAAFPSSAHVLNSIDVYVDGSGGAQHNFWAGCGWDSKLPASEIKQDGSLYYNTFDLGGMTAADLEGKNIQFQVNEWGQYSLSKVVYHFEKMESKYADSCSDSFSIDNDKGKVAIELENTQAGSLVLKKVDEKGKAIAVSKKFKLSTVETFDEATGKATGEITPLSDPQFTDEEGMWVDDDGNTSLTMNWYEGQADIHVDWDEGSKIFMWEEVSAPAGYAKADPIYFYINRDTANNQFVVHVYDAEQKKFVKADDLTITMTDKVNKNDITFSKIDAATQKQLPNVELKLTLKKPTISGLDLTKVTADGEATLATAESPNTISWKTTDKDIKFTGLPNGEYILSETKAPENYKPFQPITITIKNDKKITTSSDNAIYKDGKITVSNTEIKAVVIKKTDLSGKNLPGATMTLTAVGENADISKAKLEGCERTNLPNAKNQIVWTSGSEDAVIKGLPDGDYKLVESVAPGGYSKVIKEYTFTISNGAITKSSTNAVAGTAGYTRDKQTIILSDDILSIKISKRDMGGNKIESGKATFVISGVDEDENAIDLKGMTIAGKEITETAESYEFTGNDTSLKGIKDGTYTLEETTAPDGYEVVS